MPATNGTIDTYFDEFPVPELSAGESYLLKKGKNKLSESSIKKFIPIMGLSVLNKSTEEIKVFLNETDTKAFRVPANSSRSLTGYPAWDISVRNLGTNTIDADTVHFTLFNDLEQVSRYNAYAKSKGRA